MESGDSPQTVPLLSDLSQNEVFQRRWSYARQVLNGESPDPPQPVAFLKDSPRDSNEDFKKILTALSLVTNVDTNEDVGSDSSYQKEASSIGSPKKIWQILPPAALFRYPYESVDLDFFELIKNMAGHVMVLCNNIRVGCESYSSLQNFPLSTNLQRFVKDCVEAFNGKTDMTEISKVLIKPDLSKALYDIYRLSYTWNQYIALRSDLSYARWCCLCFVFACKLFEMNFLEASIAAANSIYYISITCDRVEPLKLLNSDAVFNPSNLFRFT